MLTLEAPGAVVLLVSALSAFSFAGMTPLGLIRDFDGIARVSYVASRVLTPVTAVTCVTSLLFWGGRALPVVVSGLCVVLVVIAEWKKRHRPSAKKPNVPGEEPFELSAEELKYSGVMLFLSMGTGFLAIVGAPWAI